MPTEPDADARWYPDERGYPPPYQDGREDSGYLEPAPERGYLDERGGYGSRHEERTYDDRGGYGADRGGYPPERGGYGDGFSTGERGGYGEPYRVPEPRTEPRTEPFDQSRSAASGRGFDDPLIGPRSGEALPPRSGEPPTAALGMPVARSAPPAPPTSGSGVGAASGPGWGERGENATGDMLLEDTGQRHRAEVIDRAALRRPVQAGPQGAPLNSPPVPAPAAPTAPLGPPVAPPLAPPLGPSLSAPPEQVAGPPGPAAQLTQGFPLQPPPQAAPANEPSGSVYRSKRPGLAALLIALTVLFEVPVLRVFGEAATADVPDASATIASILMMLGLPMFAMGLYGLVGGVPAGAGARAWLRTPLAYLPVGLALFVAAALAG